MKVAIHETNTQIGGMTQAPRRFAIAANEQSFSTLSSGLYNDKIRAIVRELSCNAWDAHVMAGRANQPFDIHLPTDFEPFFRITDYGTGLKYVEGGCEPCKGTGEIAVVSGNKVVSDKCPACYGTGHLDEVLSLYCTYFASNKRESNDVVGALGLGSKSPFCYTQAMDEPQGFTVTNRYQGVKRIYSAYVENGAPTCVCLSEETTSEPNGLEIQFACNTEDIQEFENKSKRALEFFQPQPNVNIEGFEADAQEYSLRTPKWGLRKEATSKGGILIPTFSGLRAIQGMVQYSVGNIDLSRMTRGQQQVANLPLDLFFNIGDLKPTASRESLSLDNHTQASILQALSDVSDGLILETRNKMNECKTAWEAKIRLSEIMNGPVGELMREAHRDGKFFGKFANFNLTDDESKLNALDYHFLHVTMFEQSSKRKSYQHSLFKELSDRELIMAEVAKTPKMREAYARAIPPSNKVTIILNDLGKGAGKYVDAYVQRAADASGQLLCHTAVLFSATGGVKNQKKMEKEFKQAIQTLGNPNFTKASVIKSAYADLIPKAEARIPRSRGVLVMTGSGYSYRGGRYSGWTKNTWGRESNPPTGTKFYIPVSKNNIGITPRIDFYKASDCIQFINQARRSNLFAGLTKSTPIYGLNEKAQSKITNAKDGSVEWINVIDYIIDSAQTVITDAKVLELSIFLQPFQCPCESILEDIRKYAKGFKKSPLVEFAQSYFAVKGQKKTEEAEAISYLIDTLSTNNLYKKGATINFKDKWQSIVRKRYPMLAFTRSYSDFSGINYRKTVLNYIHQIDSKEAR